MSVTFSTGTTNADLIGWQIYCLDCEAEGRDTAVANTYPNRAAAIEALPQVRQEHAQLACEGEWVTTRALFTFEPETVNVSNSNAREILYTLGLGDTDEDLCGSCDPDDFEGRIAVARALAPQVELPAAVEYGERGARVLHSAREAGYLAGRFECLSEVCAQAKTLGRPIVWS